MVVLSPVIDVKSTSVDSARPGAESFDIASPTVANKEPTLEKDLFMEAQKPVALSRATFLARACDDSDWLFNRESLDNSNLEASVVVGLEDCLIFFVLTVLFVFSFAEILSTVATFGIARRRAESFVLFKVTDFTQRIGSPGTAGSCLVVALLIIDLSERLSELK